jgi:hypothetical protein
VPDGDVAGQAGEIVLVESLGHQAHRRVRPDPLAIGGRYPDALLATVLQGVKTKERRAGYVFARRVDAYNPTSLLRMVVQERHSA